MHIKSHIIFRTPYHASVYPRKKANPPHHHNLLTNLQKGRMLEVRDLKRSYAQISDEFKIPRSIIATFLNRFEQCGRKFE